MGGVTFEDSIAIRQVGEDVYESLHAPFWTWPGGQVVPGGTLMSLATAAAYETVSSDFVIDTLHTYFLAGPNHTTPVTIKVQRINNSGRFATRAVTLHQGDITVVHVTCSFVRTAAMSGPTMTHTTPRSSPQTLAEITLDDLAPGKTTQGPIMKFQRLPLLYTGPQQPAPANPHPTTMTYTSAALIFPPLPQNASRQLHTLAAIMLSDYHVLDGPPTLHGIPLTQPAVDDYTRTLPVANRFERFTSLSHTIRFRLHEGFRADETMYLEVGSPWAERRRAEVRGSLFTGDGRLVTTIVQGSYYVLKAGDGGSKL